MSTQQSGPVLNVQLDDKEVDVIRYALSLLKKDCRFDLETFARNGNLDRIQELVDTLSSIEFLFNKIKF